MKDLSRDEALSVIGKWERQNQSFSLLCMSPAFFLSSRLARTVMCLDYHLDVSLCDDSRLQILLSGAVFSEVAPADLSTAPVDFVAEFDYGIRIMNHETHWYLLRTDSLPDNQVVSR
jgi:hypothetical protein